MRVTPFGYLCWCLIFIPFALLGLSALLDGLGHRSLEGIGMGLLFVGIGGAGFWFVHQSILRDFWLRKNGRLVSGVVTNLTAELSGDSTRYELNFVFVDDTGSHHQGVMSLFQREFEKWAEGDPIQVYYDPQCPGNCIADVSK